MNNTIQGNITGTVNNATVAGFQDSIMTQVISPLLGLASAVCFVLFLYGIVKFLVARANNDSAKFEAGKWHIIWGGVGLFVLFSMWGILKAIAGVTGSNIWFK